MSKFMKVQGQDLIDKDGNKVVLKGVGLGGWMLPEGYMWGNHNYYERPRRFEELVEYYLGVEKDSFWDEYYAHWISDRDFKLIKEHGYDHVRLAMNFRLLMVENEHDELVIFNEYGFNMIDYTIKQCKKNDLYLVLDLHGAPGGQTGTNIDDSKYSKPELFEKRIYQLQTITLWKEIAKRYKDEETIIMYDLLNEPLPDWNNHLNKYLEPLHEEIIKAIREEDADHIISIEGAHWATDFSTITKKLDDNMILHFHKYWSPPSIETIQTFLDKRDELNLPLYMGEGGENDLYWYSSAFKMYDQLNISWNFWAYKKRNNHNSVISYNMPENWKTIFDKNNPLPIEEGRRLLKEFIKSIKFKRTTVNQDVTNHLFYKDQFFTTGGLYDYLGKGNSFNNTKENETPVIRPNDKTFICDKDGNEFKPHWNCFGELEKKEERYPFLKGHLGDFYNYSFNVTELEEKQIRVTHNNLEAEFLINDLPVKTEVKDCFYEITFIPSKKDNILTIKPFNDGVIKYIYFD